MESIRKHIMLTQRTQDELTYLVNKYGEKESRLIARLITETYLKEQDK